MMHDRIGTELIHSISCDVIHIRFRGGWWETRVMWLTDWGTVEGREYKIETSSNQSFFYPSNRVKLFNESDFPSVCNTLRFPRYQDIPWYISPYDTIFPTRFFSFRALQYIFFCLIHSFAYQRTTVFTLISMLLFWVKLWIFYQFPWVERKKCLPLFGSPHKHTQEYLFLKASSTVLCSDEVVLNCWLVQE